MNRTPFLMLVAASIAFYALPAIGAPGAKAKPIAVTKINRTSVVDFEKEILPLFNASCLACHNKTKPKAGLVLETPGDLRKGGENGPAVVAGKPAESLLIKAATHGDANVEVMPPPNNKVNAPNLTSEQLGLVSLWIEQGATGEVKGPAPIAWQTPAETVQPIYAVAVTSDGSLAAAGRGAGIDLYDLKAGKLLSRIGDATLGKVLDRPTAHHDLVQSLAFSKDGKTLASGAYREVKLWRKSEGDDSSEWKLEKTIGTGANDSPLLDRVNALDFNDDDTMLAMGGGVPSRGGQIVLYSLKTDKVERALDEIHSDSVTSLQFSTDGKKLVTGSADKFVRLINVEDGKVIRSFEGHTHQVLSVAMRKDGKVIASAGADNSLKFWDAETGERRKQSGASEREFTSVRYMEGDTVVACSGDAKVRLFKDSGNEAKSLPGPTDFMYAAAASGNGKFIVAGGQDGVFRVWGADGKPMVMSEK